VSGLREAIRAMATDKSMYAARIKRSFPRSDLWRAHAATAEQLRDLLDAHPEAEEPDLSEVEKITAALAEQFAQALNEARAEVLREAADRVALELGNEVGGHTSTFAVRHWLHERADALDPEKRRMAS
jgi:hypothetical protein